MGTSNFLFNMRSIVFLLTVVFLASSYGCGGGGGRNATPAEGNSVAGNTPEEVRTAVVTALRVGDVDKALLQFDELDQKRVKASFEALGTDGMKQLSDAVANGVIIEQTESKIIYKTTMIDEKGSSAEVKFRLYNVNGRWVFRAL